MHGSQPSYSSENHSSSYYRSSPSYNEEKNSSQPAFNPAEHYQNIWDPWEEYDSRQLQNQTVLTQTFHDTHHHHHPHNETHKPDEMHKQTLEAQARYSGNFFDHQNQTANNPVHQSSSLHHHSSEPIPHNESYSHDSHIQGNSSAYQAPENTTKQSVLYSHPFSESHNQSHFESVEIHSSNTHNEQKQHLEYHKTNAYTDADHCQLSHPQVPSQGYSPPQSDPIVHNDPSVTFMQEISQMSRPPPSKEPSPRLPNECVTTTTVSNDITLQSTAEDTEKDVSTVLKVGVVILKCESAKLKCSFCAIADWISYKGSIVIIPIIQFNKMKLWDLRWLN